jgi:hypothetical protein
MSARLTVIFYIMICFEIGALLVALPWTSYWSDNFFLFYLSATLHTDLPQKIIQSGYARGAVTGLGLLNIAMGFVEIFNFRKAVETVAHASELKKS